MVSKIDIRPDHLEIVQSILREHLPRDVKVWVFGSRAKWSAKDYSDLDLALEGKEKIPSRTMTDLEYAFEESALPWKVDVLDINAISPEFRAVVEKGRFEFPLDVRVFSLITYISRGVTPKYTEREENSCMILNQKCIRNFKVSLLQSRRNNLETRKVSPEKRLYKYDVLINSTGVGTLGRVAQYLNNPTNIITVDSHVTIVRPDVNKIDPLFFGYLIKSKQKLIESFAMGTTGQTELSKNSLSEMEVDFVKDKKSQKKIGKMLLAIDNKITLNQQINQTLEGMAQAVFKSWFVDFEPVRAKMAVLGSGGSAEDANLAAMQAIGGKSAEELQTLKSTDAEAYNTLHTTVNLFPSAMIDSELGEIPEGWEVKEIRDLLFFNPKETIRKNTIAQHINMAALPTSGCCHSNPVMKEFKSGTKFRNGDILFARITPCLENGKTAIVNNIDSVYCGSTEFIVMRAKGSINNAFIYSLARCDTFRNYAQQNMIGTSGKQRVSHEMLGKYKMPTPKREGIYIAFSSITNAWIYRILCNHVESQTLTQIRDTLLPKLLSGEIDVSAMKGGEET